MDIAFEQTPLRAVEAHCSARDRVQLDGRRRLESGSLKPKIEAADPEIWEKAIEVRDKPVTMHDVQIFGKKCVDMGVREAAVAMVSGSQEPLDAAALTRWANGFGIGLTLFRGWPDFVEQTLFWSGESKPEAANRAIQFIHQRLVAVEASPAAVALWQSLVRAG